eukprot:TRINITY_DN6079_c0_g1_i1.p2 TRINITY_DN6079_c0_g1~~TRINITY_DN6079_c0_g1_i1.p2  ORF type:complete len:139 (-),score=24.81 TRINITY_DN6079_c0_g1_i1:55-471(-)
MLDPGEELGQAASREVWEECGVRAKFECVLGFRHMHNYSFERGDIYFICLLRPESEAITLDPLEIAKCSWIPVEEFVKMATFPLQRAVARLADQYLNHGYRGFHPDQVAKYNRPGNTLVYHASGADLSDLLVPEKSHL